MLRILGPNCVALPVPGIGFNASFARTSALPGKTAFVSRSGALVTAVLGWARSLRIGFSTFVSPGEGAYADFGDVLDYLAVPWRGPTKSTSAPVALTKHLSPNLERTVSL